MPRSAAPTNPPAHDGSARAAVVSPAADRARRQFVALCITMMLLGTADLIRFSIVDLSRLRDAEAKAETELESHPPAPPELAADDPARQTMEEERGYALESHRAAADGERRGWGRLGGQLLALLITAGFLVARRNRPAPVAGTIAVTIQLILSVGLTHLASRLLVAPAIPGAPALGLAELVLMHGLACILIPWSPRTSILPMGPLLVVWAVTVLAPGGSERDRLDRLVGIVIAPIAFGPGIGIASLRLRRRNAVAERAALGARLRSVDDEFNRARAVHDAMFPNRFTGRVGFDYEYHPMHELGGDYVHVHVSKETGCATLTLLDVAGHGLAAALTVNRLFGELERIRAEDEHARPAQVMELLNRYIHFTLARHSIFATGACIMIDPADGALRWVNAGHPPAFVRRSMGEVHDLGTTAMLLGVLGPTEFEPHEQSVRLAPGDTVIAYTDGAFEARNPSGVRFGLERLRETARFNPPPRNWPRFIAGAVAQHHQGSHDDDVLIAALTLNSLGVAVSRTVEVAAR